MWGGDLGNEYDGRKKKKKKKAARHEGSSCLSVCVWIVEGEGIEN